MANLTIPVQADIPAYKYQIDLEGSSYILNFRYNERMDNWVFDIFDENENPILLGTAILVDQILLERFQDERLPPGRFIAIDESGEQKIPRREDLGNDVKLFYIESA